MWLNWFIIAGILFVGEIATAGFILFWFGVGALVSAVLALIGMHIYVQIAAFVVVSTILLIFTRPIIKRMLKGNNIPSNVYALSGKIGMVVQDIDNINGEGQVKVNGEIWRAESEDGSRIQTGTEVKILRVEGVRLVVNQMIEAKL